MQEGQVASKQILTYLSAQPIIAVPDALRDQSFGSGNLN
jgi:hypothetical protein